MAKLVIAGDEAHTDFEIDGVTTIGRQSSNDVSVQGEKVSRQHARIIPTGDKHIVEDLGSGNGTFINGTKISRGTLRHGDTLRIGDVNLIFRDDLGDALEGELLGNYRIRKQIGQGGMGAVYRAIQISMDRSVALKLLKPEFTRNPTFVKSFISEARTAGKLNHPNIVQVHDFGEVDGVFFFSMEFVEGETLHDVLAREGKVPVGRSLDIVIQVAKGLEHAQKHDIIHRDIKPQNVMIDRKGQVKVADLGLAKVIGRRESKEMRGTIMGTPHYMAPEQARSGKVDGRADIYALGATWYHMITGRVPFDGPNSLAVITKHINQQLQSPKQYDMTLPDDVCLLIGRMMAKEADQRPNSASDLLRELERVKQRVSPTLADTAKKKETAKKVKRKARTSAPRALRGTPREAPAGGGVGALLPAVMVTVVVLLGLVVYLLFFGSPAAKRRPGMSSGNGRQAGQSAAELANRAEAARATGDIERELGLLKDLVKFFPDSAEGKAAADRVPGLEIRYRQIQNAKAEQKFTTIMGLPRSTQEDKAAVVRLLKHFLALHGDLPEWASKARVEIAKLELGSGAEPVVTKVDTAGGTSGGEAEAGFIAARARASKLERLGQFSGAKRAYKEFIEANRGTQEAREAARALADLERRADAHYSSIFDRAVALSRKGDYVRATALFTGLIADEPAGPYAEKARKELRKNDDATERLYRRTTARAGAQFKNFNFDNALRELKRSQTSLAGTRWGEEMSAAIERMALAAKCFDDLSAKIKASPGKTYKMKDLMGRPVNGRILSTDRTGLQINLSGAEVPKQWAKLTDKDVYQIHLLYEPKGDEHIHLGAYFLCRDQKAYAKTELETAIRRGASPDVARRLLGIGSGASAQVISYDFGRWEHAGDWEASGGNWSILGGQLVQEGRGESEIALQKPLRSKNFSLTMDFTVTNEGGLFAIEFVQDEDNCLGLAVDPRGVESTSSIKGAGKSARGSWKYSAGRKHKLKMKLARDILTISIDGKKMPELSAGGMERLSGKLVIKCLDTSAAVDNIVIGEER